MEMIIGNFEEASDKLDFEIKKALMPLGIYPFKITAKLGTGRLEFETRFINFDDEQEIQNLNSKGLLNFLDKETYRTLEERGLIPK
jgi:hypothetical protein